MFYDKSTRKEMQCTFILTHSSLFQRWRYSWRFLQRP